MHLFHLYVLFKLQLGLYEGLAFLSSFGTEKVHLGLYASRLKRVQTQHLTILSQIFKKLNILPFVNLNDLQVACFMYRAIHWLLTTSHMFITNNYVHFHDTRLSTSLHIFDHTVRIIGPILWNSLSADLRNISIVYLF